MGRAFATCLPLEIPLRGLPSQMKSFGKIYLCCFCVFRIFLKSSFEKEIPSGGSQAGNIFLGTRLFSGNKVVLWEQGCTLDRKVVLWEQGGTAPRRREQYLFVK